MPATRVLGRSTLLALGMAVAAGLITQAAGPSTAPSTAPAPVCRDTAPGTIAGEPAHPGDGVPHPEGRIVFGQITRVDEMFGQIVALYAIDPDGSDVALVLDCETAMPTWSPDGSRIAFTLGMDDGSWQIGTVAPDGTDLRVLTSGHGIFEVPTWSPDGTWLVYDASPDIQDPADRAFHTTLWRMDADGTNARQVGDPMAFDVEPRLSPDGSQVVFTRLYPNEDWMGRLFIRDLATGIDRNVLPMDRSATHPDWTPDGKGIIYNSLQDPDRWAQLETIDANDPDATPKVLFAGTKERGGYKGSYSPDGTRIVFGCNRVLGQNEDALCLMDADGSNVIVLRDEPLAENHFTWGQPAR